MSAFFVLRASADGELGIADGRRLALDMNASRISQWHP